MLIRALLAALVLAVPLSARAADYVVRQGDSLGMIAARYHISLATLAQVNGITNINLVQIGRILHLPSSSGASPSAPGPAPFYRVRWGDTLSGIAARYGTTISELRALNASLGAYPLAGQLLQVGTGTINGPATSEVSIAGGAAYTVAPGDSLSGIAARFGVLPAAVMALNGITDPNRVLVGARLRIPGATAVAYDPQGARQLIVQYAQMYGIPASFALAIAWQESGFNQSMVSSTGAIGVMQVEPYTGDTITNLLGRTFNLHDIRDNVRAGVFWLARLDAYYGGNQRLAAAAYYQGSRSLARNGLFTDTVQYVGNVMALETRFSG